jgi:hypothetical protein
MKNSVKIKRLLKLAQEGNLEAWMAVKAELESPNLPPGLIDEAAIQESNAATEKLVASTQEAKAKMEGLSPEEKQELASLLGNEEVLKAALSKVSTASEKIDLLFVKIASKYIEEDDAINFIRNINLYKSLNGLENKIASKNNLARVLAEKEFAFEKLSADKNFLIKSGLIKISSKYQNGFTKEANSWLSDAGKAISDSAGEAMKAIKGAGSLGRMGRLFFKFLGTILPFVGVWMAGKELFHAYNNVNKSLEFVKKQFSDLGDSDSLLQGKYISQLVSNFSNDPEKLLRVTQLNKIAEFYESNWWEQIYSALWLVSDFFTSIAIIVAAVATVATGGAAAGIGAVIMAPLAVMAESVLGKTATTWIMRAGLTSLVGTLGKSWFGWGLGGFEENKKSIAVITDSAIKRLSSGSQPEGSGQDSNSNLMSSNDSDAEALKAFEEFQASMAAS